MSDLTAKRVYIWKLAEFLATHGKVMSGQELAGHLNRNGILTESGEEYEGARGTYTLIENTYKWLRDEMGLQQGADHLATAFVKPDGTYAYE